MRLLITRLMLLFAFSFLSACRASAGTVTFGSGVDKFTMEFVTIGNSGNAPDTTGYPNPAGSVGYVYGIGKYEVREEMITRYNASFGSDNALVITTDNRGADKPATAVSWSEAARFVNWLNTSKGFHAAYKFTTQGVGDMIANWSPADVDDYDPLQPYRSKRATFVLTNYNEFYKAAFYDIHKAGGPGYWNYATGSDDAPTPVAFGTDAGTAVYKQWPYKGPADVQAAGGLSPYGVMGLGGNVWEWLENNANLMSWPNDPARLIRGGDWLTALEYDSETSWLSSSYLRANPYDAKYGSIGFRVAMLNPTGGGEVPEPTSVTIFGLGTLGLTYLARRKSKAMHIQQVNS